MVASARPLKGSKRFSDSRQQCPSHVHNYHTTPPANLLTSAVHTTGIVWTPHSGTPKALLHVKFPDVVEYIYIHHFADALFISISR